MTVASRAVHHARRAAKAAGKTPRGPEPGVSVGPSARVGCEPLRIRTLRKTRGIVNPASLDSRGFDSGAAKRSREPRRSPVVIPMVISGGAS